MEASRSKPQWYHWTLLIICSVTMLAMGISEVVGGASPDSRFYAVDDILVRVLGAAMIGLALLLFLRRTWAFAGAISILGLSILEVVLTTTTLGQAAAFLVVAIITFGAPIALLAWLLGVFVPSKQPN